MVTKKSVSLAGSLADAVTRCSYSAKLVNFSLKNKAKGSF